MRKLSVTAIALACLMLANGSPAMAAMSQLDWGCSSAMSLEDANGNTALAAYSQIILAALHPGVTDSQVQLDFAAGNVSKILTSDFDVYNYAPLGWSGGCGPTGLFYQGGYVDFALMAPAGLVNVETDVSDQNTTMINYFKNKPVYYLAIDATCTVPAAPPTTNGLPVYAVPSGITEMGIWGTHSGGGGNGLFPSGTSLADNGASFAMLDDNTEGYYPVVGQYGVPAGPALEAFIDGLGAGPNWPVAELAHVPAPAPEPSTLLLLATGLLGLLAYAWRKRR